MMTTTEVKKDERVARCIKAVTNVKIGIEPPDRCYRYIRHAYGTPKYWEELAKEYQAWVSEFGEFLRDHRSQDANIMTVDKTVEDVCSCCNNQWEEDTDDGVTSCAHCGARVANEPPAASTDALTD